MPDLRARLAHLLETGGPRLAALEPCALVIYGAGNAGRAAAAAAQARGFTVHSFLDARAVSMPEVDGIRCYLPESTAARAMAAAGMPVVLAIFNHTVDLRPIVALLRAIGFGRVITFYELHEHFGYGPQFWLGQRAEYPTRPSEILAGFDLFEDDMSRQIFHDYIALRLTFDLSLLVEPDQANHYLPADLPRPRSPLRVIDGGAFTGDTIELLLGQGMAVEAVAAFEPDAENFRQLGKAVGEMTKKIKEVILFPCGLSNETALRSFSAGAGAGSALDAAGTAHIQVVALDDALPAFAPTFIKLDIEGAEPQALAGAEQTIARHRPVLAVCVYHAPDHLWTLPALIRRLWPGYRLALRYHQFNGFDVVAYALPR